jgi:hypothetical protein
MSAPLVILRNRSPRDNVTARAFWAARGYINEGIRLE